MELMEREEIRQVALADRFLQNPNDNHDDEEMDIENESDPSLGIYDPTKSHRPDKRARHHPIVTPPSSQRRRRSINSVAFKKALTTSKSRSSYTKIVNIIKRQEGK